jgi:aspartate ammonia-lyase
MVRLYILGTYDCPTKPSIQSFRQERDTFGDLQVPAEKYWGAQTQRYVDYRCLFILTNLNAQVPPEL